MPARTTQGTSTNTGCASLLSPEALRGVGRRGGKRLGGDDADVRERAPALLEPEAVAGEELVRDGEPDVLEPDVLDEPAVGPIEQRHGGDALRVALREGAGEEGERQPGVDDV